MHRMVGKYFVAMGLSIVDVHLSKLVCRMQLRMPG